ncbi:hypothetical protein IF1G_10138 [Cordyceps javanica]|uniref:Uncharacterized protein n=1 Tax=Cordyceps javanica TaxID=43265 RepID=A0A545UP63_9HYPO|nr:hypothetical protein IF1G_10138 [Cordyceps javanica]
MNAKAGGEPWGLSFVVINYGPTPFKLSDFSSGACWVRRSGGFSRATPRSRVTGCRDCWLVERRVREGSFVFCSIGKQIEQLLALRKSVAGSCRRPWK